MQLFLIVPYALEEMICTDMSLEEKVGQMMLPARDYITANGSDITDYFLGGVLSGGGSAPLQGNAPSKWADMVDTYQVRLLSGIGVLSLCQTTLLIEEM
jgi:hypothetical protein